MPRVLGDQGIISLAFANPRPRRGRYVFSFADWRILTGPLVYAWVDRREVFYVGMSASGFTRILTPRHHALNRYPDVVGGLKPRPGMRLYVWPMKDAAAARALERKLITAYRPVFNRAGKAPIVRANTPIVRAPEPINPHEPPLAAARRRLSALVIRPRKAAAR